MRFVAIFGLALIATVFVALVMRQYLLRRAELEAAERIRTRVLAAYDELEAARDTEKDSEDGPKP